MRLTALGSILALTALVLFGVAFVRGSVGPALAGLALLAFLDGARRSLRVGNLEATREVPGLVGVDLPFETTVTVRADAPVPLRVVEEPTPGATIISSTAHLVRETASVRTTFTAQAAGTIRWNNVLVTVIDAWGLWSESVHVPAPARARVMPEAAFLERGRRTGRRFTVQESVKSLMATEALPEVRMVRPYMPSDRVRDIDWRTSARMGELHARERERAGARKFLLVLDATRSMRRPGNVPKLRTATRIVSGLAGAAQGAGVSAALVAFHEGGLQTLGDATTRASLQALMDRLARLPPVEGAQAIRLTTDLDRPATGDEHAFLRLVAPLAGAGAPAAPSLDAALGAVSRFTPDRSFAVAIMDGEVNPRRAEVAARRLQRMGHDVVVVIPATGPHHATKQTAAPVMDELREAMARRASLKKVLTAMGVPLVIAHPGQEDAVVREVAACAV